MSRLTIDTPSRADLVMEQLYKDLERRIESSPPGLCPVDLSRAFLELCHAQTCGKCVPCRVGLGQLNHLIRKVLNGNATMETLDTMEQTAKSIMESADCAIGYEAAHMVYKGLIGYRDGNAVLASTMAFGTLCSSRLVHGFNCKANKPIIFTKRFWNNIYLIGAFVLGWLLITGVLMIPALQGMFKVQTLTVAQLMTVYGLALLNLPVIQLLKWIRTRKK